MAKGARLADRCAIVTGAEEGIGAAVAARFAEEGARVVCLAAPHADAAATAAAIDGNAIGICADVTDEQSVELAVQTALDELGRLDLVCNAAATTGPFLAVRDMPADDWDATIALNLRGTFLVAKHTMAALQESDGNIVNVASALAFTGWRHASAYGPTNAAIVQLTQSMALDYAPTVRVNVVCPGPMSAAPLGRSNGDGPPESKAAGQARLVVPSDVADAALFLASDDASYMTGAALPVDGGFLAS